MLKHTLKAAALAALMATPASFAQEAATGTQGNAGAANAGAAREAGAPGAQDTPAAATRNQDAGRTKDAAGAQDVAGAHDETPGGAAGAHGNKAAVDDTLFAAAAASGGLAEVTISQLGVQRATDPELKRFSQQMVDEHTRMNSEMMALASQKRVALPRTPDVRAQFCAQSLAGLSGAEFDRCYAKAQFLIHMDSVAMFQAEAERGQDPDVKALAAKALPHIKAHLKQIQPIAMKYEQQKPSTEGAADDHAAPASR